MDCLPEPELRYDDFSARVHKQAREKHIPVSGSLEVTFRCNLRCEHCYLAFGRQGLPGRQELTLAEIRNVIDQIVDEGCLWFLLTGGEPLVRPDLADIYLYAKRKGLLVTLFTNATLLTPSIADLLAEWRPLVVEVSLYGHSQATYERVTGVPGSHARCLRGIELLLKNHIPVKLKTPLLNTNCHELGAMQSFARSLGVEFRFDPIINPGLDGSHRPLKARLSPEAIVAFEQADADRVQRWQQEYTSRYGQQTSSRLLYTCAAGESGFHIDPYGELCLCMLARQPSYSLRQGPFRRGWQEFIPAQLGRECSDTFACSQCHLRTLCSQCPALARLETGDEEQIVPFLCAVAQRRAHAFYPEMATTEKGFIL